MFRARIDFFELVLENEFNSDICVLTVPNASKATAYNRVCVAYNIVEFLKSTIFDFNCQLVVKHDWGVPYVINNWIHELSPSVIYGALTCHYQHTKNAGIYHVQFKGEPRHFPATGYTIDIKDLDPVPYDVLATLSQSYPELEAVLQQDEYKMDLERNEKMLAEDMKVQKVVQDQRENLRKMLQGLSDSFDQMAKSSDKKEDDVALDIVYPEPTEMLPSECSKAAKCKLFHCPTCDVCYKNRAALVTHMDAKHLGANAQSTSPLQLNKCHLCNVTFPRVKCLNQHLKMHSIKARIESEQKSYEERSLYKCTICDQRFIKITELSAHIQSVHKEQSELKKKLPTTADDIPFDGLWLCSQCDKHFATLMSLNVHVKKHQEVRPVAVSTDGTTSYAMIQPDGRFPCRLCDKTLDSIKSLNAHMKSHEIKARDKEDAMTMKKEPIQLKTPEHEQQDVEVTVASDPVGLNFRPARGAKPLSDGLFHCRLCDYKFELAKSLNVHMKLHSMRARTHLEAMPKEEEPIHQKTLESLNAHMKVHVTEAHAEQEGREEKHRMEEEAARMEVEPKPEPTIELRRARHYPIRPTLPCRIYSANPSLGLQSTYSPVYPHMTINPNVPYRKIGQVLDRPTVIKTPEKVAAPSKESEESLSEILKKFAAALDAEKLSKKPRSLMSEEELITDIEAQQNKLMQSSSFTPKADSPYINLTRPPRPGRLIAQEIAASPLNNEDGDAMPVQVRSAFNDYQDGRLSYFDMRDLLDCLKEIQLEQGMKTALDIAIDSLELLEIQKRQERKRSSSGDDDEFSAKSMKITEARLKELFGRGDVPDKQDMGRSVNEANRPSCSKEKLQVKEYSPPKVSEEKPVKIVDLPPKEFYYRKSETGEETGLPNDIMLVQIHNTPMKSYGRWCKHLRLPLFEHYLKFEVTKPEETFEPIAIQLGGNNVQEYYVTKLSMIKESEKKAIISMHIFVVGLCDEETISLVLQMVDKKNGNRPLSNFIYLSGRFDKDRKPSFYNTYCKMGHGHPLPKRQNPLFNVESLENDSGKAKLANWRSKLTSDNLVVCKESDLLYLGNWCSHVGMPVFKKTIRVRTIDGKAFKPEKWTMQIVKNENLNTVMMPFVPKSQQTQYCRKLDLDLIMIVEDPLKKASAVLQFNKRSSSDTVPFFMSYSFLVDERSPSNMYFKDCEQPKAHPWPAQLKSQKFYPSKIANIILSKPTVIHGPVPPSRVTVVYPTQPMEVTVVAVDEEKDMEKTEENVNMPAVMEVVKGDSFSSHTDMQKMNGKDEKIEVAKETSSIMKLSDFCEKRIEEDKIKAAEETKESEDLLSPHETLEFDFVEKAEAELTEAEAEENKKEDKKPEAESDFVLDTSDSSDFEMVGNSDTEDI